MDADADNPPLDDQRRSAPAARHKSHGRTLLDYALTALVAVALALAIQAFVVKPYLIPSVSMANTLLPGQRVLVDRLVYHYRAVHRGDIIVFRWPGHENETPLIKRVVGLPGDRLSLRQGRLYVNGHPLPEGYVKHDRGVAEKTLPAFQGVGADAWSLATPYTVPPDHFFVMGDNRTESNDSRYWGTVPRDHIIGRAFFVYWPPERIHVL
jgi:signal peptidase I